MKRWILIATLVFFGIAVGLASKNPAVHHFNVSISQTLQSVQPGWLININVATIVFEYIMVILWLPICLYLFVKGRRKEALLFLLAGSAWFVTRILKWAFQLPCPAPPEVTYLYPYAQLSELLRALTKNAVILNAAVCYPSGHVFNFISFWGMLFVLKDSISKTKWIKKGITLVCVILITLIGESLVAVGGHWFTDVVGGYLFGFAWLLGISSL